MKLNSALFPYPVLATATDDYKNAYFQASIEPYKVDGEQIRIDAKFALNDDALKQLIYDGKAAYMLHIEGENSAFRIFKTASPNQDTVSLFADINQSGNAIFANALVVATEDIPKFISPNFNQDFYFDDYHIENISRAQILAYQETIKIRIESENVDESLEAPIKFEQTTKKEYFFDFSGDDIIIKLPGQSFDNYKHASVIGKPTRDLMIVTYVLPALTAAVRLMKKPGNMDTRWASILQDRFDDLNYEVTSDRFNSTDSEILAQNLLGDMVEPMMANFVDELDND